MLDLNVCVNVCECARARVFECCCCFFGDGRSSSSYDDGKLICEWNDPSLSSSNKMPVSLWQPIAAHQRLITCKNYTFSTVVWPPYEEHTLEFSLSSDWAFARYICNCTYHGSSSAAIESVCCFTHVWQWVFFVHYMKCTHQLVLHGSKWIESDYYRLELLLLSYSDPRSSNKIIITDRHSFLP